MIVANAKESRDTKIAHELFTINTLIVHLFLTLCFSVGFGSMFNAGCGEIDQKYPQN